MEKQELYEQLITKAKKDYTKLVLERLSSYKELIMRPQGIYSDEELFNVITYDLDAYLLEIYSSLYYRLVDIGPDGYEEVDDISEEDYLKMINMKENIIEELYNKSSEIIDSDVMCEELSSTLYDNFIPSL